MLASASPWRCSLIFFGLLAASCATAGGGPTKEQLAERIRAQTGHGVRPSQGPPEIPSGVTPDDGLTSDESVAVALWNNPDFAAGLSDLGIARAEIAQAGLLRNPVLSLLLPWGPKQLEATARWPIEAIWQRPRRVRAAKAAAEATAERLVVAGLSLVGEVRLAHADLWTAEARRALAQEAAQLSHRVSGIVRNRYDAGDISRLESEAASVEAARADQDVARAALDVVLAADRLHQLLGVADRLSPDAIRTGPEVVASGACTDLRALETDALAARPEVRVAELDIEAAGARVGWERSRAFTFVAVLDANAKGSEGFELGPGIDSDLGLFDRNQAGVLRAGSELERSRARYLSARYAILRELRDAHARFGQADRALAAWRDEIRPKLEQQAGQTERAYEAGELPLLSVLDLSRRLNEARSRELDAAAERRRAVILLERSAGRGCAPALPR